MSSDPARQLAQQLLDGRLNDHDFVHRAAQLAMSHVGEAQVDLDRRRRCGYPEVVYGEGKSSETIARIFRALLEQQAPALATRISAEQAADLAADFPEGHYNVVGRTFRVEIPGAVAANESPQRDGGRLVIVTAGTTDLPVAEEARETALWMGVDVQLIEDVGVAGPQRLLARLDELRSADAIVVAAGMEGALPSVVGGHVACPVVAVPTSVGYGASFGGLAALLGMLNSCASNVTVVNIDAGFKAAYVAGLIVQRQAAARAGAGGREAPG